MALTVHQVAEKLGIDSNTTDRVLFEVKVNQGRLKLCEKPHDFSIVLDRITKEPIENPTPDQRLFARCRCTKCGGEVDAMARLWYERGLEDKAERPAVDNKAVAGK